MTRPDPEPFRRLGRRFLGPEIGTVAALPEAVDLWTYWLPFERTSKDEPVSPKDFETKMGYAQNMVAQLRSHPVVDGADQALDRRVLRADDGEAERHDERGPDASDERPAD